MTQPYQTTATMTSTVNVSNISPKTTEKEVREFFSFCGKIQNLSLTPTSGAADASKSATITFERDSAAKTAILLDGTPLNNSPLSVSATHSLDDIAGSHATSDPSADEPRQEDKPRSAIFAEYLAHGYVIGDSALNKGLELDSKHGISQKFSSYLNSALQKVESTTHATDRARAVDTQYGVTQRAGTGLSSLQRYFEQALGTPTGQKIRKFYDIGEKQVLDIHAEAKRLAELKKGGAIGLGPTADGKPFVGEGDVTKCGCAGNEGVCKCAPGACACSGCQKTGDKSKASVAKDLGEPQTKCACAGNEGVCKCAPGQCSCAGCQKTGDKSAGDATDLSAQAGHAGSDIKETAKDLM